MSSGLLFLLGRAIGYHKFRSYLASLYEDSHSLKLLKQEIKMLVAERPSLKQLKQLCSDLKIRFHVSTVKQFLLNGDYVELDEVREARLRGMWRTGYFYPIRNGSGDVQKYQASIPEKYGVNEVRWNLSGMTELDYRTISRL